MALTLFSMVAQLGSDFYSPVMGRTAGGNIDITTNPGNRWKLSSSLLFCIDVRDGDVVGITETVGGVSTAYSFTIRLQGGAKLVLPLPAPVAGVAYDSKPIVQGGTGTYSFFVSSGALPPGLTLNAASGRVSGTPTSVSSFAISVVDLGQTLPYAVVPIVIYPSSGTPTPTPSLTLTGPLTFVAGAAAGTLVANIGNVPAGVTPTITPNDGRLVVAGSAGAWTVVTGMSASSAGMIALTASATGATDANATVTVAAGATVPAAPTLGTPTVASGSVSIPFTDGATGGSAITSHNVYRSTATGAETLLGNLTGASPFVDTSITNGVQYFYKLSAVNGVGEGAMSAEVAATPTASSALLLEDGTYLLAEDNSHILTEA